MFRMFFPDAYLDSVHAVDFVGFRKKGYKAVLFDIDNTLVCHGAPATPEIIDFFYELRKMGYQAMVMSNNKEPRVKSFAEAVGGIGYIYKAGKPSERGYLAAMEQMGTTKETTLFIGDQLFTDVWGAKKLGITNYLVKPIHPKEEIQIVIKRFFEKVVLFFYHRSKKRSE